MVELKYLIRIDVVGLCLCYICIGICYGETIAFVLLFKICIIIIIIIIIIIVIIIIIWMI